MQAKTAIPSDSVIRQLCIRAKQGSASAREKLLRVHLGLVIHIASRFYRSGAFLEMGDLIQQGCLGLLHSIDKYNPARKAKGKLVRFATYAHYWISHSIRREIETHGRTIAVPIRRIRARKASLKPGAWVEDENGIALMRVVDLNDTSDNWCRAWENRQMVEALLARISKQSRQTLACRFGLNGTQELLTQEQTARRMNLHASRVAQIERAALKQLQAVSGRL